MSIYVWYRVRPGGLLQIHIYFLFKEIIYYQLHLIVFSTLNYRGDTYWGFFVGTLDAVVSLLNSKFYTFFSPEVTALPFLAYNGQ